MKTLPIGFQVSAGKAIETSGSHFRLTEPVDIWGGNVLLQNINKEKFIDGLIGLSNDLKIAFPGYFLIYETGVASAYHISRYSRKKYGQSPSIETCRNVLKIIGDKFNISVEEEQISKNSSFRILFGLQEGYEKGVVHTIQEVKDELRKCLPNKDVLEKYFGIVQGEICTIRNGSCYTEDAAVITVKDINRIIDVFSLAERFSQERISVEDFSEGITYMVETKYCKTPD